MNKTILQLLDTIYFAQLWPTYTLNCFMLVHIMTETLIDSCVVGFVKVLLELIFRMLDKQTLWILCSIIISGSHQEDIWSAISNWVEIRRAYLASLSSSNWSCLSNLLIFEYELLLQLPCYHSFCLFLPFQEWWSVCLHSLVLFFVNDDTLRNKIFFLLRLQFLILFQFVIYGEILYPFLQELLADFFSVLTLV